MSKPDRDEMINRYIAAIQKENDQAGYSFSSEDTLKLMLERYGWRYDRSRKKIEQKNEFKRRVKEGKRY